METKSNELLVLARELAKQAEEIGKLKVLNEVKSKAITGLLANLGLETVSAKPSTASPQIGMPAWYDIQRSGYSRPADLDMNIQSTPTPYVLATEALESTISEMSSTEAPKRKCGRPKGSKNAPKKSSKKVAEVSVEAEPVITSVGGSVFKEFTPLSTENLVTPNANAYIPRQNKDSVFSVVS